VCLGLLSKGNRDLHTQRTMEIPFAGGLLCAERTSEHRALYQEGVEAVFWSDARECAERCRELLADGAARADIAKSGRRRCMTNGHLNEPVLSRVLCEAMQA
jgi:spore maturation protein CgeB